jgi:phosphoenolpyruvate carboxykinase (GTP)
MARDEGWLAEHMLILGITSPQGKKKYIAAAFPSACGKTNLAMLIPTIPGWKVECVGDDISWMKFGPDNRLYAINPEAGFFGVATGTSMQSNPNAMLTVAKNTIFTNVGLADDGDVWWEGIGSDAPEHLIDWQGKDRKPGDKGPVAHPNARFTAPASQCPVIDREWQNPKGVPISAFLFGGRRPNVIPLVNQARSWQHGVFLGSIVGSEITAAAISTQIGTVRRDPMAMLPFCGYHMGDYLKHWLSIGKKSTEDKLPKIFYVNWFRRNGNGKWLWPGYGENSRVLKWIFERTEGEGKAQETPIGILPAQDGIDTSGLTVSKEDMKELLKVDPMEWQAEIGQIREHYARFGECLPKELWDELAAMENRLK